MQGILEEVALLQEITEVCREAVRAFVEDRTDKNGRVSQDSMNNFARSIGFGQQPWTKPLKASFLSIPEVLGLFKAAALPFLVTNMSDEVSITFRNYMNHFVLVS